ncbi:MAG: hypothetical protein RL173_1233 [Fibrobacterota bacterium]|jgi:ABC-type multidrug transport system ATPase subunit
MSNSIADHTPIRLCSLCAGYENTAVLHDVDLVVEPGERLVLLGPNGAGKTTLFRCLLGLIQPMSGAAFLLGHDPSNRRFRRELMVHVGTCLESPGLPAQTRPLEYLEHFARLTGLPSARQTARQALKLWELPESVDAQNLSLGQRQRLQVARSLLHSPRLAILDEPAANLDPSAQESFWQLLDRWQSATGSTLVVSTHHLEEAYRHGPRWVLLGKGRILADGSPANILSAVSGSRHARFSEPVDGQKLSAILDDLRIGAQLRGDRERRDSQWRVVARNGHREQARIVRALVESGLPLVSYGEDGTSLEESYRILLGDAKSESTEIVVIPAQAAVRASAPSSWSAVRAAASLHGAALARERRVAVPLVVLVGILTGSVLFAIPDGLPSPDFYLPLLALASLLPAGLAGGMASDLVAGERERRSLETFLCAPASPSLLIAGRAVSILLPAIGFAWVSMLLVYGALAVRSLSPTWIAFASLALTFAPAAILLSLAVGVWVSSRSRTVRSAAQLSALVTVPLVALSQAVPAFTPAHWLPAMGWFAAAAVLVGLSIPVLLDLRRRLRPENLAR